ncbi:PLP-dependent aminotransferase family protein [Streptomyces sp. ICN441]|uniref:aminotransferase-like domain-containing protein n=1 Tax=Streptomyces sp. ICN441 TaxID=2558286 RepID=UPI00141ADB0E|nr:PLP-dependent aminotransferase family protein [Streptomyces sp. ICN441]
MSPAPPPRLAALVSGVEPSALREILALTSHSRVVSFAGGLPDPELFDHEGLRLAFERVLAPGARHVFQYSRTEGDPELRAAIAGRLCRRGLPTAPDDLLITTGSQQALALTAAALLDPGDTVLVEEPCYLAALQCFGLAGARVVPLPAAGPLDPDLLGELVRRERPKLLYLIPNFQNPTGRTMTAHLRYEVARVAADHGLWIVEDDPYGELRYRGEPAPAVAACPGAEDRTILVGSFSKILAPGLRIGWLRAPHGARRALHIAKQTADLHTSTLDQAAVAAYLAGGRIDGHIAGLRQAYASRMQAMLEGLANALPDGSTWSTPDGGMFLWVRLPEHMDAEAVLPAALRHNVAYVPGSHFFTGRPDPACMRLSFTAHPPERIADGLARLGAVLQGAR